MPDIKRQHIRENRDVISFFSGAMGLDIGLMKAGLNIAIGQDFDKTCIQTMRANGHNVMNGDIREINPQDILEKTGLEREEAFLVCGGPPCQPFSTAGKRLGINDPRGSLFMDYVRMIDYIRPRFFIMENVKGIISAKIKNIPIVNKDNHNWDDDTQQGSVLKVILSEFSKLGYRTIYGILDAVNYGVPQFRERFILIGSRDHEDIYLPIPTHFQLHQSSEYLWRTLRNTISDLENLEDECTTFSGERMALLRMIPEGGNWRDLPDDLVEMAMGGAYNSGGGKAGFFRRLSYDQPAPTLMTSPIQKASMLCHPTKDRPLNIREYARIQQFPDDWIFTGTTTSKYRQIGNAVPVDLAEALGLAIISVANNSSRIKTKRIKKTHAYF